METRAVIVSLFEKHRASPGASFDESHFLDYLLPVPAGKRAVYNSFRGLRRLNAFIEDVQLEFAICLSLEDHEANYSLEDFVDRVEKLRNSRSGSLRSLQNQVKAGASWPVLVVADLFLVIAAAYFSGSVPVLVAIGLVALGVNAWFFRFAWRARAYLKRLKSRIVESQGKRRAV